MTMECIISAICNVTDKVKQSDSAGVNLRGETLVLVQWQNQAPNSPSTGHVGTPVIDDRLCPLPGVEHKRGYQAVGTKPNDTVKG